MRTFLAFSDVAEQIDFWRNHLDTRRFRAGFDTLMSAPILRAMYARQFLSFLPSRFGAVLRKRLERGFVRHPNLREPVRAGALPRRNRARILRRGLPNVRFVLGDAASWLESCPAQCFDGFTLSNILDGAEPAYRVRLMRAVRRAAREEAIIVSRSFAEPRPEFDSNLAECDRSMLWGVVDVRSAHAC